MAVAVPGFEAQYIIDVKNFRGIIDACFTAGELDVGLAFLSQRWSQSVFSICPAGSGLLMFRPSLEGPEGCFGLGMWDAWQMRTSAS